MNFEPYAESSFRFSWGPEFAEDETRGLVLAAWEEIAPSLPPSTRLLAKDVVDLCERYRAFSTNPACDVGLIDDDCIMFDWNNGNYPILTLVVTPERTIIYVGKSRDGKTTGETDNLNFVKMLLSELVREIGNPTWPTLVLHDLSARRERAHPAQVLVRDFILHPEKHETSLSLLPTVPPETIYVTLASGLLEKWGKRSSTVGPS